MRSASFFRLALLCAGLFPSTMAQQVGDSICAEGYVMDRFCIDNVQMIDNGRVTLEEPFEHSVHCLVDVDFCREGPFEILLDPTSEGAQYTRGWTVDAAGTATLVDLARTVSEKGYCSTCRGPKGALVEGFRAGIRGTVVQLANGNVPPVVSLQEAVWTNELVEQGGSFCGGTQAADSEAPTDPPTSLPTKSPTTESPTDAPMSAPTNSPTTRLPTAWPTTPVPTATPTFGPTKNPSSTTPPTSSPTEMPTTAPSDRPSDTPSSMPSYSLFPTMAVTDGPTGVPSLSPITTSGFNSLAEDSVGTRSATSASANLARGTFAGWLWMLNALVVMPFFFFSY